MRKVLITGSAGFIGFHVSKKLINLGYEVVGLDNISEYYDKTLKYDRLTELGISKNNIKYNELCGSSKHSNFKFIQLDLEKQPEIDRLFEYEKFDYVIHLAAQAGVRYSITNPQVYIQSNLVGFANIIEASKCAKIKHFVYASSSSVYGLNEKQPFSTEDRVDHPISLYASTKKANELMAHSYSHIHSLPTTGLRFFTVYGPWGRPDMAPFIFAKSILEEKTIEVFNYGKMQRDFTFVNDIVEVVSKVAISPPVPNVEWNKGLDHQSHSSAPYRIYNVGLGNPIKLLDFIGILENALNKKAILNLMPIQSGDMVSTFADTSGLQKDFNYQPATTLEEGINKFAKWYVDYYKY